MNVTYQLLVYADSVYIKGKAKVSLCLAKHQAMKTYLGWRYSSTHSWPRH